MQGVPPLPASYLMEELGGVMNIKVTCSGWEDHYWELETIPRVGDIIIYRNRIDTVYPPFKVDQVIHMPSVDLDGKCSYSYVINCEELEEL